MNLVHHGAQTVEVIVGQIGKQGYFFQEIKDYISLRTNHRLNSPIIDNIGYICQVPQSWVGRYLIVYNEICYKVVMVRLRRAFGKARRWLQGYLLSDVTHCEEKYPEGQSCGDLV